MPITTAAADPALTPPLWQNASNMTLTALLAEDPSFRAAADGPPRRSSDGAGPGARGVGTSRKWWSARARRGPSERARARHATHPSATSTATPTPSHSCVDIAVAPWNIALTSEALAQRSNETLITSQAGWAQADPPSAALFAGTAPPAARPPASATRPVPDLSPPRSRHQRRRQSTTALTSASTAAAAAAIAAAAGPSSASSWFARLRQSWSVPRAFRAKEKASPVAPHRERATSLAPRTAAMPTSTTAPGTVALMRMPRSIANSPATTRPAAPSASLPRGIPAVRPRPGQRCPRLPTELWCHILGFLPPPALVLLCQSLSFRPLAAAELTARIRADPPPEVTFMLAVPHRPPQGLRRADGRVVRDPDPSAAAAAAIEPLAETGETEAASAAAEPVHFTGTPWRPIEVRLPLVFDSFDPVAAKARWRPCASDLADAGPKSHSETDPPERDIAALRAGSMQMPPQTTSTTTSPQRVAEDRSVLASTWSSAWLRVLQGVAAGPAPASQTASRDEWLSRVVELGETGGVDVAQTGWRLWAPAFGVKPTTDDVSLSSSSSSSASSASPLCPLLDATCFFECSLIRYYGLDVASKPPLTPAVSFDDAASLATTLSSVDFDRYDPLPAAAASVAAARPTPASAAAAPGILSLAVLSPAPGAAMPPLSPASSSSSGSSHAVVRRRTSRGAGGRPLRSVSVSAPAARSPDASHLLRRVLERSLNGVVSPRRFILRDRNWQPR
ncbi:hypothetical protein CXG81DRAFT_20924 [Caulochytrium protostelioides]|uniref:F-box domain-containing protein n=1 Tax=Caulochytrium protostelioides TaxID=1555241 RepID=A0A4P9X1U8_9FUNG|nr:hypothetical protein CXG81DRAFT_20924 [Caulochytrium protostelioides]|eukprot:RKO98918.1 hypothetical protein CXG81DRAFT_20924 [Caulochytrium protostelioides]